MNAPDEKPRFPNALGMEVAAELCRLLKPACARLIVAGSLRRRRETVGDVEIVYISKHALVKNESDLFGESALIATADIVIAELERRGVIERRLNARGATTFGPKNKLMRHVRTGLPVDLFATCEESWWNYLVCRTGPADSNAAIASRAERMGWKWNPYGAGFERGQEVHQVQSEEEVFRFVGMPYRQARDR